MRPDSPAGDIFCLGESDMSYAYELRVPYERAAQHLLDDAHGAVPSRS